MSALKMDMTRKDKIVKRLQKKPKLAVNESSPQQSVKPALQAPIKHDERESISYTPETESSQPCRSQPFRKSFPHKPFDRPPRFPKDEKKKSYYEACAEKRMEKGFFVLGKGLENKIYRIKTAMRKKGKDPEEIRSVVNEIRRTEEMKAKKMMQKRCYCCRSADHTMKDCKQNPRLTAGVGDMCYRCGSGEHFYKDCPSKSDNMDYVVCFICEEKGHVTRNCPKNDKGAFPRGGECKKCGAKDHLAEGCKIPDEKEDEDEVTLPTINDVTMSADAEILVEQRQKSSKPKVVAF